jgi:PAS domain S-box-containing protein
MENAANAIIITDARGIIIWANPAFEYLTGYSFEEVSGHNPREIIKSGKHDRIFYMNMWDTIMSGKVWKGEIINRRKDGTLYTEEMTIAPVKDKNGEILNYVAIKQDITERNLAIKILKDSLSEKRELIREIYHRTKNNMQVIISMFSLQSMLDDDEKVAKVLRDMENRIRTMALVHEKLYQSRDLSKLDLKDYLLELINNIITGYITDRKKIVIKEKMENLEVLIDTATTCGLVVNELVTNAAKYAFPGIENGELKISLARDKAGEITLIIADNGCGAGLSIDLENTESMGIQIVKNIVEYQMKGNIKLDSSTGVKWTITFNDNVYNERV